MAIRAVFFRRCLAWLFGRPLEAGKRRDDRRQGPVGADAGRVMAALLVMACAGMVCAGTAAPARATAITKDIANAYYRNCMGQQDARITPDGQEALCSCTAARMTQKMTVEDVRIMGRNDQEGRKKLNYMLVNVYGPCMQYPVQDLVITQCLSDPKIDMMKLKRDRGELCECMGERTGEWFSTKGNALITKLLERDPNLTDPIGPIMESTDFKRAAYNGLLACTR